MTYTLPMKDGKVDIDQIIKDAVLISGYGEDGDFRELFQALVSHARAEERERCFNACKMQANKYNPESPTGIAVMECGRAIRNMEDE